MTKIVEIGKTRQLDADYRATASANGIAVHPAGSALLDRRRDVGPDVLLLQLVESGLIEPDALGDQLAGYRLTAFAQRRLYLLWSITSGVVSKCSGSEEFAIGLAG